MKRTTIWLLLAAVLLPSLIFVALQFGFGYRAQRQSLETATAARADAIMAQIDGNMQRTRASILALASAAAVKRDDWPGAYNRARELAAINRDWKSVRLIDVRSGEMLFDLRRPFGKRQPFAIDHAIIAQLTRSRVIFEGIERTGPDCPCLNVDAGVLRDGKLRYMVTVVLDPGTFQSQLMTRAPKDGTSALVDGKGKFIARTQNISERLGKPATHYVRDAIRSNTRGIYRGITFEGLENYTAFTMSPITGWSSHVAVPHARFDTPLWWSRFASATALIISLALAVGLIWALLRLLAAQRNADLRVLQAQRLEAVGKMTGGIAHDFNNMLAIVIGSLDLVRHRRAAGRDDIDRYIDNAMDGAARASELTRRLLAFSRRQTLEPFATNLNTLVTAMAPLLSRTLDETVRLRFDLAEPVWRVLIDPGQLENAIVNLVVNARDALPSGGEVTIATANVTLTERQASKLGILAGDFVRVRVIDDGQGMSEETIRRAFEPFFTTKEVGRGTGLGLSQIHGFIEQSGGRARILSQLGEGTTIELFLPRLRGDIAISEASDTAPDPVPAGSPEEIILVTEDEDQVRLTNVEALRELGYSVRHAANAIEALNILETQPGISLLFTDMVMPGMNGRDLANVARERFPDLKLLFTTGYERERSSQEDSDKELLRKPFTLDHLAHKIRATLDG